MANKSRILFNYENVSGSTLRRFWQRAAITVGSIFAVAVVTPLVTAACAFATATSPLWAPVALCGRYWE